MSKTKKIMTFALILCLIIMTAFIFIFVINKNMDKPTNKLSNNVFQTDERNFIKGTASTIQLQQNNLFDDAVFVFKGKYKRSENYTIINTTTINDNELEYNEYFTYFYFDVNNVYYGDNKLINLELPILVRNSPSYVESGEIILNENVEYIVFCYEIPSYAFEGFDKKTIFTFSLTQTVFEIQDESVLISKELLGYNDYNDNIEENVQIFMKSWVEKQVNIKTEEARENRLPGYDINGITEGKTEMFSSWNIKDYTSGKILPILELSIKNVNTTSGKVERINIPYLMFNDFISEAFKYYKTNMKGE